MSSRKAVIWDMDGVIIDTAPYHLKAWQEVFLKLGVDFTEALFRESFGQRNDTIIGDILGERVSPEQTEAISSEKEENFLNKIKQDIRALPGVVELLKALSESGFRMAIASSAPGRNIRLLIKALGIDGYFRGIVSAEDVTEGKPSPQVFRMAAGKLEAAPGDCLVIEDAVAGVTAARRAGMKCLAVTNTHPAAKLAEADLTVDSLEKVNVGDIEKLLGP